ncbi:MAG TPA: hypothetical protein VHM90_15465 [Phycisphaerae bacterium]|nr:hypothetical protein [Phycisphaerae bacterium]
MKLNYSIMLALILHSWQLVPTAIGASLVAFGLVKMWPGWCRFFASASWLAALITIILWLATWNTTRFVALTLPSTKPNGDVHVRDMTINVSRGFINLVAIRDITLSQSVIPASQIQSVLFFRAVPNGGEYPFWAAPGESLTRHWPFINKTLGFQIIWSPAPPGALGPGIVSAYAINAPLWPILLLCPWAPLVQWKRWRMKRHAIKHGLCQKCFFDLRAHKPGDKCPSCGTLIPQPPAKPAPSAQTPPA